mmetsp:Transcript_54740/g.168651  ORF Transcript_54740/g.168651 Transcript_54740/m.168651 type:complete len:266 (+) Transcript_54740:708-1505(+)
MCDAGDPVGRRSEHCVGPSDGGHSRAKKKQKQETAEQCYDTVVSPPTHGAQTRTWCVSSQVVCHPGQFRRHCWQRRSPSAVVTEFEGSVRWCACCWSVRCCNGDALVDAGSSAAMYGVSTQMAVGRLPSRGCGVRRPSSTAPRTSASPSASSSSSSSSACSTESIVASCATSEFFTWQRKSRARRRVDSMRLSSATLMPTTRAKSLLRRTASWCALLATSSAARYSRWIICDVRGSPVMRSKRNTSAAAMSAVTSSYVSTRAARV